MIPKGSETPCRKLAVRLPVVGWVDVRNIEGLSISVRFDEAPDDTCPRPIRGGLGATIFKERVFLGNASGEEVELEGEPGSGHCAELTDRVTLWQRLKRNLFRKRNN